jgi:S1-C subfamily serine protease
VFAVQSCQTDQKGDLIWTTVGSGFFSLTTDTNTNRVLVGVTCNHVIDAVGTNLLVIGFDSKDGYKRIKCNVLTKDTTNDIAIIMPDVGTNNITVAQIGFLDKVYDTNTFDDGSSIVDGRGVLIVGYPLGLGLVGNENRPIVRFGMVAQNSEDRTFLIDGMASHGNSGSPVVTVTPRTVLIGMVTSFKPDSITLFDPEGHLNAQLPYNSGLACAVKASVILKNLKEIHH